MDSESELGDVVTGFVAQLTGRSHGELPSAEASRDDWLAVLRQWLARYDCGLVSIANPQKFSWPGALWATGRALIEPVGLSTSSTEDRADL